MVKHSFALEIEFLLRNYIDDSAFMQSADMIERNPFMYIGLLLGFCVNKNELNIKDCNEFLWNIYDNYSEEYSNAISNFERANELLNELKSFLEK